MGSEINNRQTKTLIWVNFVFSAILVVLSIFSVIIIIATSDAEAMAKFWAILILIFFFTLPGVMLFLDGLYISNRNEASIRGIK